MSPRIRWQPRHYVWLIILIAVMIFVIVQQLNKGGDAPIKDLTTKHTETPRGDASYINDMITQLTDGPFPFVSAERKGDKIVVKYENGGAEKSLELTGIKLPENVAPVLDPIKYMNDFLKEQFIRIEKEPLKDHKNMYIYAMNRYVDSPNKIYINVARHLISKGLVWVDEEELENSEYKDYFLADSDIATQDGVGIYKDLKQPEKEETGN